MRLVSKEIPTIIQSHLHPKINAHPNKIELLSQLETITAFHQKLAEILHDQPPLFQKRFENDPRLTTLLRVFSDLFAFTAFTFYCYPNETDVFKNLMGKLQSTLEAATQLLFVMTSQQCDYLVSLEQLMTHKGYSDLVACVENVQMAFQNFSIANAKNPELHPEWGKDLTWVLNILKTKIAKKTPDAMNPKPR